MRDILDDDDVEMTAVVDEKGNQPSKKSAGDDKCFRNLA
jgi:hypothetical protein